MDTFPGQFLYNQDNPVKTVTEQIPVKSFINLQN